MCRCIDQHFPCQNHNYSDFDKIAEAELLNPTPASDIVNNSQYCNPVPADELHKIGDLTASLFLKPLAGKIGVYHMWSEYEYCDEHKSYTMQCEYVGKGPPGARITSHIKKKWQNEKLLHVTFYECENRLAKYYEQLFLDKYQFELNKSENNGTETLYAIWTEERFRLGTHSNEISSLSKMNSPDDW